MINALGTDLEKIKEETNFIYPALPGSTESFTVSTITMESMVPNDKAP